jgi:hypothetical protein
MNKYFPHLSKYRNRKAVVDGIVFHSQKEATYYCGLKLKIKAGLIKSFDRQLPFVVVINNKKCFTYYADFVTIDSDGNQTVIDVKGFRTPVYKLKKKIVEAYFGIVIVEV